MEPSCLRAANFFDCPPPARPRPRSSARACRAQDYPTRPVRWLIGFAPGGPNDILARIIGQHLSEKLGQPFVIETRPGAGGNLATRAVARAAPDGHTLLGIGHFNAINATLYQKLPFDFVRDIVPVAGDGAGAEHPDGSPVGAGEDGGGIHRLSEGQPGQAQLRLVGQRHVVASGGRAVQGDDRHLDAARAVSRHRRRLARPAHAGRCRSTSRRRWARCNTCRTASCGRWR